MILKASQRGGGQELAAHLLNVSDNEHLRVHEVRGFACDDLHGAFKESEAIARGTKCQQHLFSLSLSPPERASVPEKTFEQAIDRIEKRLGLEGQPRAVVFHEKEGRRHAHCVWSRIDPQTMTARALPYFKRKLMEVSRDFYLEHGWKLPRGFENAAERNPTNFTLAEWQQAKRQGMDPRWLKQTLQACWSASDCKAGFAASLQERGFILAKGDKRSHVIVDHSGEVHSLPRALGLKTKDVRARLGQGDDLPSVEAAKKQIGERMTPAIRRHIEESRAVFLQRSATLAHQKMRTTHAHRAEREKQNEEQARERAMTTSLLKARLPRGIRGLWHRITGEYQKTRAENERETEKTLLRQSLERDQLARRQLEQRAVLQEEFKTLRARQAEQLNELRRDVGRFLRFSRGDPSRERSASLGLHLSR